MEKYLIQCSSCNNRVFTDGKDLHGLVEVAYSPPPLRANGINKETAKLGKRFRCNQCGNLMKAKALPEQPAAPEELQLDRRLDVDEMTEWKRRGKPKVEDFIREIDSIARDKNIGGFSF